MSRLSFLARIFRRPKSSRRDDAEKAHDQRADARTHDMLDGKGLSPTGEVMDFERDSQR